MMQRPSWDEYFMQITKLVATRSTCMRRQVGALLVKEKNIVATGYNGVPSGITHCDVTGCLRDQLNVPSGERHELCRGLHAARHGANSAGSTLYCTDSPCIICSKMLINAGIVNVIFGRGYPDKLSLEMLTEAGIEFHQYTGEVQK